MNKGREYTLEKDLHIIFWILKLQDVQICLDGAKTTSDTIQIGLKSLEESLDIRSLFQVIIYC